jgi:hypothetical protein
MKYKKELIVIVQKVFHKNNIANMEKLVKNETYSFITLFYISNTDYMK